MKHIIVFENNIRYSRTIYKSNGGDDVSFVFRPRFQVSPKGGVLLQHGGVFTNKEVYPPKNVLFSWDVSSTNYSTKSTVAKCVKRLYYGCIFELLGAFEIPQKVLESGVGRSMIPIQVKLSC